METKKNLFYMDKALGLAQKAFSYGEVPVGALIVNAKGKVIAKGYNQIEKRGCQIGHAEVIAIQKACKKRGNWRLDGCSIYVTLEPCLMCLGLIQLSRIEKIYFGVACKEFGSGLDDVKKHKLYNKNLTVTGGVRERACVEIIRQFFVNLRKKRKVCYETKD